MLINSLYVRLEEGKDKLKDHFSYRVQLLGQKQKLEQIHLKNLSQISHLMYWFGNLQQDFKWGPGNSSSCQMTLFCTETNLNYRHDPDTNVLICHKHHIFIQKHRKGRQALFCACLVKTLFQIMRIKFMVTQNYFSKSQ